MAGGVKFLIQKRGGTMTTVFETNFTGLNFLHRGKVRDIYGLDDQLLMVATDRISAFDVVLPTPIPDKGRILTQMSLFWFDFFKDIVSNHVVTADAAEYPDELKPFEHELKERSMLIKKASPLPVECIVRGYLSGSGWKDYQGTGAVCGIGLPEGMQESGKLPGPIFTPSTKAELGTHDENIDFNRMTEIVGKALSEKVRDISLKLYTAASEYARERGVIIADTKFEFGMYNDEVILIDEVLTPDSSRFWPADIYEPGKSQPSFDKQFVRDYLLSLSWDKTPPGPKLPDDIVKKTRERYLEALRLITGKSFV
jgi:phosphoribosylaminoimidazole-succinocarboxamide synthase